ncbi:MAG: hypothetical protein QOI44_2087 [Actinomycetota bacterium]|nr:hypothetical protein [Actinomycetota bacterium]
MSARESRGARDWFRAHASRLAPLGLVAIAIAFNLFVFRAEVRSVFAPNDTGAHISMVRWAENRLADGHLVFDGWYPRVSFGVAQFHHYQSLAPILGGAIALVFGAARTVAWSNYLLVSLWPLCIYWSVRLFRFDRWTAGIAALISPLISSTTLYGFEHGSFQWRGNGIWTALWGMWLMPLALGFSWRAVSRGKGYALAALFLGATLCAHFLTGYLAMLALGVWVVVKPQQILVRLGRAAIVGLGSALVAAWVLVPLFADSKYSARTEFNANTFWSNSFGGKKVMGWLFSGELFDHGRWPVLSVLVAVGVLVCLWRRRDERARVILAFTALGLLMFCGRGVLGPVVDHVLPGGKELLLHRFIIGVHFGGLVLAGIGASFLAHTAFREGRKRLPAVRPAAAIAVLLVLGLVVLAPAWRERAHTNALDAQGIDAQRVADATDGQAFTSLATQASATGGGRIYAGAPASIVKERIGQVPTYIYLLDDDVDAVGFGLRTLSLSSDVEVRFNDSSAAQFNLFNIRWLILPTNIQPAVPATRVNSAGRWQLWEVPTTGYLQVVDTAPAIEADRTNIGLRTAPFLGSSLPAQGIIPGINFAGGSAAAPTDPGSTPFATPPGRVTTQLDRPDDGVFSGDVTVERPSVVMLKATYDPRWKVTVDGKPAHTQMLAPSFIGVSVSPGAHHIEFKYVPYPYYWLLLTIGGLTLLGLALVPRRLDRRRREALERSTAS